jgi:hypothetical protein
MLETRHSMNRSSREAAAAIVCVVAAATSCYGEVVVSVTELRALVEQPPLC